MGQQRFGELGKIMEIYQKSKMWARELSMPFLRTVYRADSENDNENTIFLFFFVVQINF